MASQQASPEADGSREHSEAPDDAETPAQSRQTSPTSREASPDGKPSTVASPTGHAASPPTSPIASPVKATPSDSASVPQHNKKNSSKASEAAPKPAKRAAQPRKRPAANPNATGRAKKAKVDSNLPPEPESPENSFRGIFNKDLPGVMYGFGDSSLCPVHESVEALDSIATEFVRDILTKAHHQSAGKPRVDMDDIMFVIRKDVRKVQRANELLQSCSDIKEARKATETTDLESLAIYNSK